jgi:hypothetical protein
LRSLAWPFALQYENREDEERKALSQVPGFQQKRLADFAKVGTFWSDLGFRKLPDSDFYAYAHWQFSLILLSLGPSPSRFPRTPQRTGAANFTLLKSSRSYKMGNAMETLSVLHFSAWSSA